MAVKAVYALHAGAVTVPRFLLEAGSSPWPVKLPFLSFAIEHTRGWVWVDTGPGRGWRCSALGRLGRWTTPRGPGWRERLAALGAAPEQACAVVMTHLDGDHTGGLPACEAVPVYVSLPMLQRARDPEISERMLGRYCREEIDAPLVWRPFLPERLEALAELGAPFDRGLDLFGDRSLFAVALPGHTIGHCGVLVRWPDGRRLLIAGDAAHCGAQLRGAAPGWLTRFAAEQPRAMVRTLERLRCLVREGLPVYLMHDPALGRRAEAGPLALEPAR